MRKVANLANDVAGVDPNANCLRGCTIDLHQMSMQLAPYQLAIDKPVGAISLWNAIDDGIQFVLDGCAAGQKLVLNPRKQFAISSLPPETVSTLTTGQILRETEKFYELSLMNGDIAQLAALQCITLPDAAACPSVPDRRTD
jgi:hypothetical protein